METVHTKIKKDFLIWKFGFYGLLKNLKFFEPYLFIYLLAMGINLFQIGILFAIREVITYIFEVPSGIFADHYGKKTELLICFVFYVISFVVFFLGKGFWLMAVAMLFFGLGEAFRSGTHKAMIYSYLEQKGWFDEKTFVYGRTRSFSLIGSAVSAFVSIIFVLNLPAMRWIFLITTLPYILDFFLILSYPNSLNEKRETDMSIAKFWKNSVTQIKSIFKKSILTKLLISSSLYDAIFKTSKDYIQPILKLTILASGFMLFSNLSSDENVKVILGIVYGVFYIFSSLASRNAYRLNRLTDSHKLMNILFDVMGVICLSLFFVIRNNWSFVVIALFFVLFLIKNARRPLWVDVAGDLMEKRERATVMSIDSQFRAIFMIVLAPLLGYIAENLSIATAFLFLGGFMLFVNLFLKK
jgi:MFS family permease